jgi:Zn-dependent M28 family amino/carboxypeptidase
MLDSWPRDRPARFIFFDGEETGLRGSRGHVRDLVTRGRRHEISAVICPDSVGLDELHLYTADRAGPFPDDLLAPARRAFREHGWAPLERAARSGASDYLPFHELGIPCLFLSDFPNLTRHTTGDGLDRVKLPVLVRLARVLASPELSAPPS